MTELSFVSDLYRNVLFREPDTAGANYWVNQLTLGGVSRDTVRAAFLNSPEADLYVNPIIRLYENILGRAPDAAGLNAWSQALRAGTQSLAQITAGFLNSTEGQAAGWSGPGVTGQAFITKLYTAMGRTAEQVAADPGAAAWANALNAGRISPADVAIGINESAENKASSAGFVSGYEALRSYGITNPTTAQAQAFSNSATTAQILTSASTVTGTSVPTGVGVTPVTGGVAGQVFTLTAATDSIQGTAGDDTIVGGAGSAGGANTLGAADVINGGGGTDTLSISLEVAGTTNTDVTPNLTAVEVIVAQALGTPGGAGNAGVASINLVNATGVQQIWNQRSTDDLFVTNAQALATVGVKGDVTGIYSVGFKDALASGTSDVVSINLNAATIADLRVGGMTAANEFETINIDATGKSTVTALNQVGGNALAATKVVNVTGTGSVTVTNALAGTVTTVDATKNTGGVDLNLTATGVITATGGSGNDTFRLGGTLTTGDKLDGGTGTNTLGITAGNTLVTGLQVSNFQTLDVGGANAAGAAALANNYDLSKLSGITTLAVGSAINADAGANDVVTINNLAKGAALTIAGTLGTGAGDQLVVNVKDAGAGSPNDVIGVTISGKAALTTGGDLDINDIETVNVTSTTTATTPVTHIFSSFIADEALTINVTNGNAGVTFTNLDAKALVLFDASAATQAVSVTTGADVFSATNGIAFRLGAGADTLNLTGATAPGTTAGSAFVITGNGGGDTITLTALTADPDGAGALGNIGVQETLVYKAATDSQAGVTDLGANKFDSITNFDATTTGPTTQDFVDLTAFGFTGTQAGVFQKTVSVAITATGGVAAADQNQFFVNAGSNVGVAVVASGADSWVFIDANKDGTYSAANDMAIFMVGVTSTDLNAADFIFV